MKHTFGAALVLAMVAIPAFVIWRVTVGVENWFADSGAGNVLMWAFVVAMCAACAAIPVGMWGLAARAWVVKLDTQEHLVSTAHTLAAPRQVRQRPQIITTDAAPALTNE